MDMYLRLIRFGYSTWTKLIASDPIILGMMAADAKNIGVNPLNLLWLIASNPSTPEKTLKKLASNKNNFIRWSVASNINTPTKTLTILFADKDKEIRARANDTLNRQIYPEHYES